MATVIALAIWVRVPNNDPVAFESWCYVENYGTVSALTLAVIVNYEHGYYWRVYRKTSGMVQMRGKLRGVVDKWSQARDKVLWIIRGDRLI
jgi:hypothetical protein